ncbi:hypothetical protein AFAEC_1008 [Aliarcobacter faecis]|uniref:autotransporter-associated beta strand repeat-containing protein n=1 Tax=Aliarcobacter faecis TaxID=1564138 RepID=UPI00047CBAAA|nr:autotransporter-associated beta strand repeat-containing protein [Aliarcobacter faecis]QKF73176.1 hypothetical protein AFAEC_1008 [Aliarcobacter faecis]
MNSFRIKDLRFRILKGGKIGLAASLMMFGVMFQSTLSANTVTYDGNGNTGIFVGNIYGNYSSLTNATANSQTNLTVGNSTDTTVFTNYYTEGGAGSGGGAGLGGVFFVDKGSTLTLNNTVFKFNTSKGGEGGSLPAQVIEDTTININQLSLGLTGFEQLSITPTLTYSNGKYSFDTIKIATGTTLLNEGSSITFSELDNTSRKISSVDKSSVTLADKISINASDIKTITTNVTTNTGFSVDGKSVTLNYNYTDSSNPTITYVDTALVNQVKDNITYGGQISFRDTNGNISTKTISKVDYNTDGSIKSFELDSDIGSFTVNATTSLDVIPVSKFQTKPYEIAGNTIIVTGATRGFKAGMILYDEKGDSTGAKITAVSEQNGVYTLTVDNTTSKLTSATSITGKSSPFISDTQIKLSAPNPDLVGASSININGTDYGISNYNKETGVITLSNAIDSASKSKVEDDGELLTLKVNTVSLSGNSITLLDKGQNFSTGMLIEGTDLTIEEVSSSNGKITLKLSGSTDSLSSDSKIFVVDTLETGGSMNNLASKGTLGANGKNGIDANYYSSFFNEGEGKEGTRGYAAKDGDGAAGGKGGNGGNGSDGLAVNPQLMTELWGATGDFQEAVNDLAVAFVPEGAPIPMPEIADIPGAIINVTTASIDLATAIANTVFWAKNLNAGLAGMGGEGGAGGKGGAGDEFFGGGAGGTGGNGGEGALDHTDGGNGGEGGAGGDAGFGAGGGAGGAGGIAGSTGGAEDGEAGDGGKAGFGGGSGSDGDGLYGNGGSGFGGAVFVRKGATLNITGNTLFEENSVMAGSSNNGGSAGESAGTALFIMKGSMVNLMPGKGNTIIFNDTIADDSASSYGGASYASGAGADIYIKGNGGLVEFNGENTYSGKTYLQGATLSATLGIGINDNSKIVFNGAGTSSVTSPTVYADNLNLGTVGTLLLSEDLTSKRVGKRAIDVSWEGSGGIASGVEDGIVVNFGQITPSNGQSLVWGSNGFFESGASDKVLTFGSEHSLGSVDFQNGVNIGSNIARVAVYNTNLEDNLGSSSAILSGNWIGNELLVGADNYDGNLILTGTNKLNKLTILDGTTATSGSGKISDSSSKTVVKMYAGKLILSNSETLDSISINQGALFVSNKDLSVDNTITNDGQLVVNTGTFEKDITNNGQFANGGNIIVNADIINDSIIDSTTTLWNQIGTISAYNIKNNGTWQQQDNITLTSRLTNDGIWYSGQQQIMNRVASFVNYEDSVKNTISLVTLTGNGTFNIDNGDLEIEQSGDSKFEGDITGKGVFTKSGDGKLEISNAQTFTGGLNVTGGTFETLAAAVTLPGGTLADDLAIYISEASEFIAGIADTVGSVDNEGLFTMNKNITTEEDFTNNGTLTLDADLTTGTNFVNNGITNLTDDRTITTTGGLSGTGTINVNGADTTLTLDQSGDETYSGKILGAGNFVKTGKGNLTLNGTAGNIDLDEGVVVDEGTLTTTLANVLATDQDITVNTDGTLHIKTGSQSVDTITNSGIVNLDDNLIVRILTNNVYAEFNQDADIRVINAIMNGNWNVVDGTRVLNTETLTGDATVALGSNNLKINQSGISTFDGSIAGSGSVEKTGLGTLKISDAQTFTGGLNVTGGTFETLAAAGTLPGGTLADILAIHVAKDSTFIAGVEDTVGSVLVDSIGTGSNAGLFTMNENITTQGDFINNGTLALNANLTIGTDFVNNGTTTLTADRTITTESGLSGATIGTINVNNTGTTLTLNQSGDTTYSGKILGAGNFVKTGTGTLTLYGALVNIAGVLTIENGKIGLDGHNIFDADLDVIVSKDGELELITGNQSIDSLGGKGLIDLGSNILYVNNGGEFTGTVTGSGTLYIGSGRFNIVDNITSTTGTFDVAQGATTTIADNAELNFPKINVKEGGTLDIIGKASASDGLFVDKNGTLHLGDAANNIDGVVNTSNVSIYGKLNGTGTINGPTTVYSGGTIAPGNSPGTLTLGSLDLQSGSITDMEIVTSGIAGVHFDQITTTGNFTIKEGSNLNISKYTADINARELNMGESIKIFNFTPGAISGNFGNVTSTYADDVILNLASGEVVGLGGVSSTDFENNVAKTKNQKSMLNSLKVENNGGVSQFYGGNLVSRLAGAYGNNSEINRIFRLSSPEAYASLIDQARLSVTDSIVKLPVNFKEAKEGLTVNTNFGSKSTSNSSDWSKYDMDNTSVKLEYLHLTKDTALAVSVGKNDRKIKSDYLTADGSGYDVSIGLAKEVLAPGLSLRGHIGYMKDENDTKRETYTTDSSASVNSDGIIGGLGLGYTKDHNSLTFDFSLDASYYNVNVDSFKESNTNKLDALSVDKQKQNGMAYQAKASISSNVTEKLELKTGINALYMPDADNFNVKAKVSSEETMFNVENPGMGQTSLGLDAGAKYKIKDNMSISVDAGVNEIGKSNVGYNTNLSFTYKF